MFRVIGRISVALAIVVSGLYFSPAAAFADDVLPGSISGTVTDAATGLPIEGIYVSLVKPSNVGGSSGVTTSADGTYTLSYVSPGSYFVEFAPGWSNSANKKYVKNFYGGQTTSDSAVPVVVGSEEAVTGIDNQMQKGGVISGRLTNASGAKLSGISVMAYSGVGPASRVEYRATSDSSGKYSIVGIEPGTYKVIFGDLYATALSYQRTWFGGSTHEAATTFTIAVNSVFSRKNAKLVAAVTGTTSTTPVVSLVTGASSSTLSWTKPTSSQPIVGYRVDLDGGWNGDGFAVLGANTTSLTNPDIWDVRGFAIVVTPITSSGDGARGVLLSQLSTLPAGPNLVVGTRTDTSITLSLTSSTDDAGGWVFTLTPSTGVDSRIVLSAKLSGSSFTFTGLSPNTTYQIRGKTLSNAGVRSNWSTISSSTLATSSTTTMSGAPTSASIQGTAIVGRTLTASTAAWPSGATVAYKWMSNGQVAGVGQTYVVQNTDANKTLTVQIIGVKSGNKAVTLTSPATAIVTGGKFTRSITLDLGGFDATVGPTVGDRLYLNSMGGWGYPWTYTQECQWLRDGSPIDDATDCYGYTLVDVDAGHRITVKLTASATGFIDYVVVSDSTSPVAGQSFEQVGEATISGTTQVGKTLTVATSDWLPAPEGFTYQWYRNETPIPGAVASTYRLTGDDYKAEISASVSATLSTYTTTTSLSDATPAISVGALDATPTPVISGNPVVGQTLTVITGDWDEDTTLSCQWYRGTTAITRAKSSSYVVTANDVGLALSVRVKGSQVGYTAVTQSSSPTALVLYSFTNSPIPTITGTRTVGSTLTAVPGAWDASTTFIYQWLRDGSPINRATGSTYRQVPADAGKVINVQVTGSKTNYSSVSRTSTATSTTASAPLTLTPVPTITGTPRVGSTLTAVTGTWDSGVVVTYQWYRGATAISNANSRTYSLTGADFEKYVTVKVTGSKAGFTSASQTSTQMYVHLGDFFSSSPITISGIAQVGSTLTASDGALSPTPDSYSYQWYRGSTPIPTATVASYTLVSADRNKVVSVVVKAIKTGYFDWTGASAGTALVSAATLASASTPVVTGLTTVGSTLTAIPGSWDQGTKLNYQWYRGQIPVPISGAFGSTYVLSIDDVSMPLSVRVTGSKDGFRTVVKTSDLTTAISTG